MKELTSLDECKKALKNKEPIFQISLDELITISMALILVKKNLDEMEEK